MINRTKERLPSDADTSKCECCGSECYDDNIVRLRHIDRKKRIEICESCYDDIEEWAKAEDIEIDSSDMLKEPIFEQVSEFVRLNRIWAFIPASEQIDEEADVRDFFDALTGFLVWRPETRFEEYCYQSGHKRAGNRIFGDEVAKALNECMKACFDVCEKQNKRKPLDVYELADKSAVDAGKAPSAAKLEHTHKFTRSKPTASVETCECRKWQFTEHAGEPIVAEPEAKHTPTPWETGALMSMVIAPRINAPVPITVADCGTKYAPSSEDEKCANAAFIVRAVNSHEALVEELSALAQAARHFVKLPTQRNRDRLLSLADGSSLDVIAKARVAQR